MDCKTYLNTLNERDGNFNILITHTLTHTHTHTHKQTKRKHIVKCDLNKKKKSIHDTDCMSAIHQYISIDFICIKKQNKNKTGHLFSLVLMMD